MPLQGFGFRQSSYERPNQDWVCRRALEGQACNAGPTPDGQCTASYECYPQRTGDRWLCTRDALGGGPCENGPRPDGTCCKPIPRCLPMARLPLRRTRTLQWWSIFLLGALLLILSGGLRESFISPGELSFAHSTDTSGCRDCHQSAGSGLWGWLMAAFAAESGADSMLCLNCHLIGQEPLNAHALPAQTLESISVKARAAGTVRSAGLGNLIPVADWGEGGSLACVRCHGEHQGTDSSLTTMSNQQCQACHARQFNDLANDHAELKKYTEKQAARIIFDHGSHKNKHHPEQDRAFECSLCHAPDMAGESMLHTGFEQACAACHKAEIAGEGQSGEKGLAVLGVPGLDLDFVEERNLAIGEWPEDADGEIPPHMAMLLSADPEYRRVLPLLAETDLLDLSEADEGMAEAIETLAWSIKRLFSELSLGGQDALQARLESVLDRPVTMAQLADLSGALPVEVLNKAKSAWFPTLEFEVKRLRVGETPPFRLSEPETVSQIKEEQESEDALDLLPETTEQSLLDEFGSTEPEVTDLLETIDTQDPLAEQPSGEHQQVLQAVTVDVMVKAGGWYRNYSTLYYRPAIHQDGFIRQWLEIAGALDGEHSSRASESIVNLLIDPKAPGRCAKCHQVDSGSEGGITVNWTAKRPRAGMHSFTRFSHQPHLGPDAETRCLNCHAWQESQDNTVIGDNARLRQNSSFLKPGKSVCVECHNSTSAGASCLTCHNYHIRE